MGEALIIGGLKLALAGFPLWMFVQEDVRKYRVRDFTLALLAMGAAFGAALGAWFSGDWTQPVIGAVIFGVACVGIREVAYRMTGTEAFGPADVIAAICAGAMLGWQAILMYLLLVALLGLAYGAWISTRRKRKGRRPRRRVPAGPGLAGAQLLLMALQAIGLYSGFPFGLIA